MQKKYKLNAASWFVCVISTVLNMMSCISQKADGMVFNDVVYPVGGHPSSILEGGEEILHDVDFKVGVKVIDSLMFLYTLNKEKAYKVVLLPKYKIVGEFFSQGHGKNEFVQMPSLYRSVSFYSKGKDICATVYDFDLGKLYDVNFSQNISQQSNDMKSCKYLFMRNLGSCLLLDSVYNDNAKFFVQDVSPLNGGNYPIGICFKGKVNNSIGSLDVLNNYKMESRDRTPQISSLYSLCRERKMIVQMPLYLNYINIIDLNGESSKTVLCDYEMVDAKKCDNYKNGNNYFTCVNAYDNYFVVRCSQTYRNSFLFYSYQGVLLYELYCDDGSQVFDIDNANGMLYTINYNDFCLKQYDISNVLTNMCKNL